MTFVFVELQNLFLVFFRFTLQREHRRTGEYSAAKSVPPYVWHSSGLESWNTVSNEFYRVFELPSSQIEITEHLQGQDKMARSSFLIILEFLDSAAADVLTLVVMSDEAHFQLSVYFIEYMSGTGL